MPRTAKRKLQFESLEAKQLLAGDVTVSLFRGNLLIQGDDAANQIAVTAGAAAGSLVIRGLEVTTVHMAGATDPAPATGLVVENVNGHVEVRMGGDNDLVDVHDAVFRRGLSISGGMGADVVRIGVPPGPNPPAGGALPGVDEPPLHRDVRVGGSLLIGTGDGDDQVRIGSVGVVQILGVSTDGGNDTVRIGPEAPPPATAAAASDTGPTDHPAAVFAGLGIDVLLGDGNDSAVIRDARTSGQVGVGAGRGADDVRVDGVRTLALFLRGGDGDSADTVNVARVHARAAVIGVGDGADQASISDSVFDNLAVEMGGGDDTLSLASTKAERAVLAGGAGGADQLNKAADNMLGKLVVTGFEIPEGVNQGPVRPLRPLGSRLLAGLILLFGRS